jgi:hypothetical protein
LIQELTDRMLRCRDAFTSVAQLETGILDCAAHGNPYPRPFVWTVTAETIIARVQGAAQP